MGKSFEAITPELAEWIGRQELFFVATAPTGADGHVNVSPKGPIESLRVLDERTVAYLDLVGSGTETVAHLRDNGRIVLMFCAFSGPPRILRLHGRGEVLPVGAVAFGDLGELPEQQRTVIRVDVERVATACGFGVPLMDFAGTRTNARRWAEGRLSRDGPGALETFKAEKNTASIDGLPALV
jgi:Pyridoxamine 5'-phosphate oxidase